MPDQMASLVVRAHPRAGRDRAGPLVDGVLEVRVSKPPTDGQANEAIRRLLGEVVRIPPSRITLVAGGRGRVKRFAIDGVGQEELAARLRALDGAD